MAKSDHARKGYPDSVYSLAANVFQAARVETRLGYGAGRCVARKQERRDAGSTQRELWAYELAFNSLKFQDLLEDVLTNSCFHGSQQTPDDLTGLALVMLYDLQHRKFQPREPNETEPVQDVREVEESLIRFRTKLAAALARYRIKRNLLHIDDVLPEPVRAKHRRKRKLSLSAWVNTLKSSVDEVCVRLRTGGFVMVDSQADLDGGAFCRDAHAPSVLLFPQDARERLDQTGLLIDHTLVIQEKSRCLAACSLQPLLAKNADILVAGSFSALTAAHVAVQAAARSASVLVCGAPSDPARIQELESAFSSVGCASAHLLREEFGKLNEADPRLQKVRVALLLPRCTATALSDPTAHIINEDGDRELLQDLAKGTVSFCRLDSLIKQQMQDLQRALTLPRVHTVVYCTCSAHAEENEQVVKRALRNTAGRSKQRRPFGVVPTGWKDDREKFFRLAETDDADGCFLCVLKRENWEAESAQDVLVRAAAKGLLGGLMLREKPKQVKKTKKTKKAKEAPVPLSLPAASPPDHQRDPAELPSDPYETASAPARESGDPDLASSSLNEKAGDARQAKSRRAKGGRRESRRLKAPTHAGVKQHAVGSFVREPCKNS